MDRIYEHIDNTKAETKDEIARDFPNFDHIRSIEQHLSGLKKVTQI